MPQSDVMTCIKNSSPQKNQIAKLVTQEKKVDGKFKRKEAECCVIFEIYSTVDSV
jgi:hypothetical protein